MNNEDILTALKEGNVPSEGVQDFCIGRDKEIEEFKRLLEKIDEEDKSIVKFLNGEFGAGKSFFLKVIEDMAYRNNFAVSWITVGNNLPFNKIDVVYKNIAKSLRCKTGTSLEHIIERWLIGIQAMVFEDIEDPDEQVKVLTERVHDELNETRDYSNAFATAIENYNRLKIEGDYEGASSAIAWLRGDSNIPASIKKKFGIKGAIDRENALNFLEALSIFIKSAGYSGLVILIDEVEFIMNLHTQKIRDVAYNYIRDIYDNCNLSKFNSTLFVFAGTPEFFDNPRKGIPSYSALDDRIRNVLETDLVDMRTPVINLKGLNKEDIVQVSSKLIKMHEEVYNWDASNLITPIIGDIAEIQVSNAGLTGGNVNARDFFRKFISLLDTVEQNPEHFKNSQDVMSKFMENNENIDVDEFDEFDDDW
ncbi:MAG: hypothetical protein E7Z73_11290 [Methanobrevibacter millerae]|uniref:Uncharacterized protein n=1 Tax=Methanobrevibacter millerae TaxID=230361 RepID=A0A8T3VGD6_9EURY|nr:BREX system ATP-binding domain-containing protein [Methanobrevibacter millerae]MBE6506292.1 hypothetical protein [Methanobrevibacter millerae]